MSFIDTFVSTGTDIITNVVQNTQIIRNPQFEAYNAAQRVFGTAGEKGFTFYNLPKFKNCFIVQFILSEYAKNFIETQLPDTHNNFTLHNVSCLVRDVMLPSFSFNVETLNQYNRSRIVTGQVEYKPSTITFYDTVDSAAYLLMDAYRKYYYGDFFDKSSAAFTNDVLSSPNQYRMMGGNWGRSVMNNGNYDSQYFFKQINVYEIDNETYTVHNMINVYVEDVQLETKSMSMDDPAVMSMVLRYEGCGNFNNQGYQSIAVPTLEIAPLITSTNGLGKSGFFKYYGELDDKTVGLATIGKIIRAGTAAHDIISSVKDIMQGNINADTIRNIGGAVRKGADALGVGNIVSSATEKFGLGNILGDFF